MKLSSIITINKRALAFLVSLLFLALNNSNAQNATSSPYSRYGIGDISGSSFARNLGMGGLEIGMAVPYMINPGNPAAYSKLYYTTFDIGVKFTQTQLRTSYIEQNTNTASLAYFDFAFPVRPDDWSVGFGLKPYSNVGYNIIDKSVTPFGDTELRTYNGSGGLNSFHIGTGKKLNKKLSGGFDVEYIFGSINNERTVSYLSPFYMNTLDQSSTSIGWFHFTLGAQMLFDSLSLSKSDSIVIYDQKISTLSDSLKNVLASDAAGTNYELKNSINQEIAQAKDVRKKIVDRKKKSEWSLLLGATVSPQADLHGRETRVVSNFRYFDSQATQTLVRDTILYKVGAQGTVVLPLEAGVGFTLRKGNKLQFGVDYSFQQWDKFEFLSEPDSLFNSWKIAVGGQYIPNDRAVGGYRNFVAYRLGFHYEQTYLNVGASKINEIGVSLGFGFPIRKAGTYIHLAIEADQRGSTKVNPIEERFLKFTLGFTINDRWFIKPKYD